MDYKVLYRKYRPLTFDDVTGQGAVVKTLKNAIMQQKISHAYIFTGPRGTGKTSLAKIFARSINCENCQDGNPCMTCEMCKSFNDNPDIIEIDAASNNGVDEIRELINNIKLAPSNSKYKVYIIDEVHMLSQSAFNALLLTLEEPPAHVVFILATTDIQNVPITILSRTQRFDFTRISPSDIEKRLAYVCEQENIKITSEALSEIAYLAEGGLRDALSILDQLASQTVDEITIDTVLNTFGTISTAKIAEFINTIENNDIQGMLEILQEFKNSSIDSKVFINKLLNALKDLAFDIKTSKVEEKNLTFEDIKKLILELNDTLSNKLMSVDPYILIEMIVLSYMGKQETPDILEKTAEYFPGNSEEDKKTPEKVINEPKKEEKNTVNDTKLEEFKKIRINNCLAAAQKSFLIDLKNKWQEFIKFIKTVDNNIYLNICDTNLIVSSDCYFIIETITDSSAGLINISTEKIEEYFNKQYNLKYKIIAVNSDEWNIIKKQYINDLNNHIKYEIKEEVPLYIENKEDIENIAGDIFDKNKIEIVKE